MYGRARGGSGVCIAVCDKITMEPVFVTASRKDAAEFMGLDSSAIIDHADNHRVAKGKYVARYANEVDKNEAYEGARNRPVAISADGKTWRGVYDASTVAERLGTTTKYLFRCIREGKTMHGFHVRYAR